MEEIKVGDYIRTELGDIKQITEGFEFIIQRYNESSNKIVKHSPNIIDLIQAGDIVIYTVNNVLTDIGIVKEHIDARTQKKALRIGLRNLEQVEIKEILTKEQFSQTKYIVGDESNE